MRSRALRIPLGVAAFAIISVLGSQPVLADTELGDTGKVGVHSLTDTHATPGAKCHYNASGRLKAIEVRPPNMEAAAQRTNQIVGWRVSVERRLDLGPWKTVYTSIRQTTSVGGSGDAGGFSSMTAPITLPANEGVNGAHEFRVVVKMFWYAKDDQTVNGTSRHRVDFYRNLLSNGDRSTDEGSCAALTGP
jgi:hypothetical protein